MRVLIAFVLCVGTAAQADSLFSQASAKDGTLIAKSTSRFQPGDLITVMVRERIEANTQANTDTKKESDVESTAQAGANEFLTAERSDGGLGIMNPAALPNWKVEAENESKLGGRTRRTSTLTTTISCIITEVRPNGLLLIQGERQVSINREDSTIVFSGIARVKDVTPANTIQSTQMANVSLQLRGKGPIWNTQRRGWFTKALDWFSPF